MTRPARFGPTTTSVLGAVLDAAGRGEPVKVRTLAARVGCSRYWAHQSLLKLRRAGLVAWEDERAGTIRATCEFLSAGELLGPAEPMEGDDEPQVL